MTDQNNLPPEKPASAPLGKSTPKKPGRGGWLFIVIALIIILFITFNDNKTPILWLEDYDQALAQARQLKKPLMITIFMPGQDWCERMDKTTYVQPEVVRYVENTFVPVRLNIDDHKSLAKKYGASIYPTHKRLRKIFLTCKKNMITHLFTFASLKLLMGG